MFIFSQENGMKKDGTSTLNSRIMNAASILIAYTALIPVFRSRAPKATKVSFVYIIIYLSILPHFLALISSMISKDMLNTDWVKSYLPFHDICFLASFILLVIVAFVVLLVVARFIYASFTQYMINSRPPPGDKFVSFEEANLPYGVVNYFHKLYKKRKEQFILNVVNELEKEGSVNIRRVDFDFH